MPSELTVRVETVCTNLPGVQFCGPSGEILEPVHLGIQKGDNVIAAVPGDAASAEFVAEFRVRQQADGRPNFLGPYAKGTAYDRFFYLSWGVLSDDGLFRMFRRLKIRLGHLPWSTVARAANHNQTLRVFLDMTDDCGEPLCATPPAANISWELDG